MLNRNISLQLLSQISAYEYFNSSAENSWVFIDLDHSSDKLRSLIPTAQIIELTGDFSAFEKKLQEIKRAQKAGNEIRFIAVKESGKNYQSQKALFSQHTRADIVYLSGGVTGLQRYRQQHLAMLERQKKGFQISMGCGR
jgi:hypothetical protein